MKIIGFPPIGAVSEVVHEISHNMEFGTICNCKAQKARI